MDAGNYKWIPLKEIKRLEHAPDRKITRVCGELLKLVGEADGNTVYGKTDADFAGWTILTDVEKQSQTLTEQVCFLHSDVASVLERVHSPTLPPEEKMAMLESSWMDMKGRWSEIVHRMKSKLRNILGALSGIYQM